MIHGCDIDRRHIELFPNNRFLPKNDVARLQQVVMYSQAGEQKVVITLCSTRCQILENITSDTSLAPFDKDHIANMLTLMDPLMSESFPDD
jgi:hypothetical protein